MSITLKIERRDVVLSRTGLSKTTLYERIRGGLMPPQVSLGGKAVGWISHEVDIILKAMICNKSHAELKKIVESLLEERKKMDEELSSFIQ